MACLKIIRIPPTIAVACLHRCLLADRPGKESTASLHPHCQKGEKQFHSNGHYWIQFFLTKLIENLIQLNTLLGLWLTGAAAVLAVYAGCHAELAVFLFAVLELDFLFLYSLKSHKISLYCTHLPSFLNFHSSSLSIIHLSLLIRWLLAWTRWLYQAVRQGFLVSNANKEMR